MRQVVGMLRRRSERFHMVIHVLFGIICGYTVHEIFIEANTMNLIFYGVLGSLLPDVDHFIYFYFYGRNSEYSKMVRKFIKDKKFRKLMNYLKVNHKKNTGLYSHNILSVIVALYLFQYYVRIKDMPVFSVLALAWFMHYIFDLAEDILFMKKVNSNWFLKFNKKSLELEGGQRGKRRTGKALETTGD